MNKGENIVFNYYLSYEVNSEKLKEICKRHAERKYNKLLIINVLNFRIRRVPTNDEMVRDVPTAGQRYLVDLELLLFILEKLQKNMLIVNQEENSFIGTLECNL